MFDSIYVDKSLILPLVKEFGFETEMTIWEDWYSFQTKDLDNFLTSFFIDKEGNFIWEKRNEIFISPTPEEVKNKKGWSFGEMKEISPPEKIEDTRTAYIEFYDLFTFDEERIFITFLAHVKNGKLQEDLKIKSIERTNLKEEAERTEKSHKQWQLIRNTWQWKLCDSLRSFSWKMKRFLLPISNSISNLENKLRKQAKQKYLDEKDIGYW